MRALSVLATLAIAVVFGQEPARAQQTYTGGGFAIPDNDPAGSSSQIVVSDGGLVGNGLIVSLTLSPSHGWCGDLIATLSHNDGTTTATADLFRRIGALTTASIGDSSNLNGTYRFSDSFTTSLWGAAGGGRGTFDVPEGDFRASTNLFTGSASSYAPVSLNTIFGGRSLAGTWTLSVSDNAPDDVAAISEWSINTLPAPGALVLLALGGLHGRGRRRR